MARVETEATSGSALSALLITSTASFSRGASSQRAWKAYVAPLCSRNASPAM